MGLWSLWVSGRFWASRQWERVYFPSFILSRALLSFRQAPLVLSLGFKYFADLHAGLRGLIRNIPLGKVTPFRTLLLR